VLLSDRTFAGSDVLATAYTLSQGIRAALRPNTYDLILCGKQTTDGDTAQVGPAVAEFLAIPHVAWVTGILEADRQGLTLMQDLTDHELKVKVSYPCLITVEKGGSTPRLPSYLRKKQFEGRKARVLTISELEDRNPAHYGQEGSPTQVERIFPPPSNADKVMLEDTPDALAGAVCEILVGHKLLEVK
jgi:electron transfer flavoprotein beta subunit